MPSKDKEDIHTKKELDTIIKVIKKWDSIVVSILSILFGVSVLVKPEMFMYYETYEVLRWWFSPDFTGLLFVGAGVLKLVGIAINHRWLKIIGVASLVGLWTFAGVSFALSSNPTTIHLFAIAIAAITLGTLLKEALE